MDGFAFKFYGQNFWIKPLAFALRTYLPRVFHEIHVNAHLSKAAAVCARSFFDVEAEVSGVETSEFAFGKFGKKISDLIKELNVSGCIGSWSPSYRRLIDGNQFVYVFQAF